MQTELTRMLQIRYPLIQAPMAGVSTPALAAAVSNAGGLGSISVGAQDAAQARTAIEQTRALTAGAFNVNVFCHAPAQADPAREAAWLARLAPYFAAFGTAPPGALREIYRSFNHDDAMLEVLLHARPRLVSLHFGLPPQDRIDALKRAGILLAASATTPAEARLLEQAGIDLIVAQGVEAGGHRGVFDPAQGDAGFGTFALVRLLARQCARPVVAAGGIMDGAGIAAALMLGAAGAQLGTAFVTTAESAAPPAHRAMLLGARAYDTRITGAISGRSARGIANRYMHEIGAAQPSTIPDYPIAYDAAKALHAAAQARGSSEFAAYWAGQGAPLARAVPAAELVATLATELQESLAHASALAGQHA
jgi:nitronate monooxygenase